jgi:hypothetical protein
VQIALGAKYVAVEACDPLTPTRCNIEVADTGLYVRRDAVPIKLRIIAKAKAAGLYKGRPASIDASQVRAMKAQGLGASEIAKALKIGRASVYRFLETG